MPVTYKKFLHFLNPRKFHTQNHFGNCCVVRVETNYEFSCDVDIDRVQNTTDVNMSCSWKASKLLTLHTSHLSYKN
jgi:hypothetical protein